MIFYRISEFRDTIKIIPFQERETNWNFTGCQVPHFRIVLIPYINLLNLSWIIKCRSISEEYGAFKSMNIEIKHKNTCEDAQEMPQSWTTALPRHQKKKRWGSNNDKTNAYMKPPTHKESEWSDCACSKARFRLTWPNYAYSLCKVSVSK